jgi:uncharacterized Zn finger protein (UPF0148 family)
MTRYTCDKCGTSSVYDETLIKGNLQCPICKGKMISETELKEREEMQKAIEEDNSMTEEEITPKQDMQEAIEDFINFAMEQNIEQHGNDRIYFYIEKQINAKQRARLRQAFLRVGGQVPTGEPITI